MGGTEYHLRSFLQTIENFDKENSYILFCNQENASSFHLKSKKWEIVICPIRAENRIIRILYEQLLFPFLVQNKGCEILHSYGYISPLWGKFKKVVTVHDANWKDHPEDTGDLQNKVMELFVSQSIRRSDKVITDSPFSLSRLQNVFPKESQKIETIVPGVDDHFLQLLHASPKKTIVLGRYILCVSAFYSHKKIEYLLQLWSRLKEKGFTYRLVLVGHNGAEEQQIANQIKTMKDVEWLPKMKLVELVSLYTHAAAFVFPSVYEGFGYPVYEALAAKIPVLVGKKELYLKNVQQYLDELSFDLEKDTQAVEKIVKKTQKKNIALPEYKDDISKLIRLYRSL